MESSEKRKLDAEEDGDPQTGAPSPKKRVIGPSLPSSTSPSAQPEPQSNSGSDSGSDSESDDDFGPSLPPSQGGSAAAPIEQSADNRSAPPNVHEKKDSQRDRWMLQPPEQSDWARNLDPTQIRNRKFQTGRSARSATSKQVDASWMETPEERMRRLGDEVMGVSAPSSDDKKPASSSSAARAKSMEDRIKEFNVSLTRITEICVSRAKHYL